MEQDSTAQTNSPFSRAPGLKVHRQFSLDPPRTSGSYCTRTSLLVVMRCTWPILPISCENDYRKGTFEVSSTEDKVHAHTRFTEQVQITCKKCLERRC